MINTGIGLVSNQRGDNDAYKGEEAYKQLAKPITPSIFFNYSGILLIFLPIINVEYSGL
jgi:hypothetical protein